MREWADQKKRGLADAVRESKGGRPESAGINVDYNIIFRVI